MLFSLISKNLLLSFSLLLLCSYSHSFAQEENQENASNLQKNKKNSDFKVSIGAFGLVNGSFLAEPKEKTLQYSNNGQTSTLQMAYPGFGGVGGGGGLNLEFAWRWVGLSFDMTRSKDQGSGDLDDLNRDLGQMAWRLPLMLKLMLPGKSVTPYLLVGWEWVKNDSAEWSEAKSNLQLPGISVNGRNYMYDAYSQNTSGLIFGFGFDIHLIPHLSLPIRLRGHHVSMNKDTLDELVKIDQDNAKILFRSVWEWQADLTIGLKYDFDLPL
jgi:hypothetical protein